MAFTNIHPAPGMGELMPGFFVVPQNPITMAQTGMGYFARMGELLPASFSVPQNPIVNNFATGMQGMGTLGCGGNKGCAAGFTGALSGGSIGELVDGHFVVPQNPITAAAAGMGGLGSLGEFDASMLNPASWGMGTFAIVGIGLFLIFMSGRPGRSQKSADLRSAKYAYEARKSEIGSTYKTRAGKARAFIAGGVEKARERQEETAMARRYGR